MKHIVIDEAYVHFNERANSPSGIAYFRRYPNVAVAHTFSKACGLAELRIGYALAPERLANALRKVAIPFGVTDLAQAAAVASLHAEDELSARVADLLNERKRVVDAFRDAGIEIAETQANFIWAPCGDATTAAAALLESHGLLVRPFVGEGFRVTKADREANDLFAPDLAVLAAPVSVAGEGRTVEFAQKQATAGKSGVPVEVTDLSPRPRPLGGAPAREPGGSLPPIALCQFGSNRNECDE